VVLGVRAWRWLRAVLVGAVVAALAAAIAALIAVPRSLAYGELLEENLVLRDRLLSIEHRMTEVDALLLRLRLYDAQLQGLDPGRGGPAVDPPEAPWQDGDAVAEATGVDAPLDGGEAGTVASWADSVQERLRVFLETFPLREPDLVRLVAEAERDHARQQAWPSRWPAKGVFSSGFGWRRDPFTRRWKFHGGLDLAGDYGTPIRSTSPGTVVRAEWSRSYGQVVEVDHGFGLTTLYAHCARLLVAAGDRVSAGDVIARMGSTGRSTAVHLHFEVRLDGQPVNPLSYLRAARAAR
jgi:murein DD-endopeptidase MepM/ murein hydrolase activator NlpD